MSRDPTTLAADEEPRVEAEVKRAAVRQLLAGGPFAESLHILLVSVVAALVWNSLPIEVTIGWVGAVAAAAGLRAWWRVRARGRSLSADEALRGVRLTVAGVGLAWGFGAASAIPALGLDQAALILVVVAGIVAGATGTLVGDRRSFHYLLITVLAPLPIGILLQGHSRPHLLAIVLIAMFVWGMDRVHGRAHRTFAERVRAAALLERSTEELARQHAYLDALIASTPVAIAVLDDQRSVRSVNAAFEGLFGYAADEVIGAGIDGLIVPESLRSESSDLETRVRRGEIVRVEVERMRKDGRHIQVRLSAAAVHAAADGALVALYEDISDRKAAEAAMREARDLAERVARARSAFLANMSHEIRTPMNAVLGFVELVLDTELGAEQRRALELVRTSSEALLTILNDILDYSKIEAEHLELESIPFDLPKVVHATATLLAVRAREKHLELTVDVPPDVPQMVRGDPTRLRQVLMNLIGNAIKFTEQGEVDVSASIIQRDGDRAAVQFRVRDTGIGISEDQLGTIFQEFTQADASMTRRYGGTGLGLAISRRLVALMAGELAVTSEVGRGSEFSFALTFPLEAGAQATARAAVSLGGRRLLVVDDNETNRRIVRDMLGAEGMAVHEASRADAGLEALRRAARARTPYDLAILDAQMPDQDGFELATAIRADRALTATRLLILTSAGQRGDGERCRQLGIQAYLTKPIARADLVEAVGTVLAGTASAPGAADLVTRHSIAESRHALRILLAEDNAVNQQVATAMLLKRGHHVDVASNGREAVDAVAREPYDVILMDIQMPEMDGFEATEQIRGLPQGRSLPIIALTAHALSGERERCLARGMSGYLAKPFKAHDLFAAVEGRGAQPADTAATRSPAVDLAAFRRTMEEAGAADAVDGILETFVATLPQRLEALVAAAGGTEAEPLHRAAHAFKSAAGTIGAGHLAALLEEMERAAQGGDLAGARDKLEHVRGEAQAALDYIRTATKGGGDA
ncbi:MAG: hybrid sensor histidine kinase/response regulator [Gemmatimonadetes bacterium]|nr:MAG: hybrid sensor histidine kinase/response regulator [Gemmatimonadota bacterium]